VPGSEDQSVSVAFVSVVPAGTFGSTTAVYAIVIVSVVPSDTLPKSMVSGLPLKSEVTSPEMSEPLRSTDVRAALPR